MDENAWGSFALKHTISSSSSSFPLRQSTMPLLIGIIRLNPLRCFSQLKLRPLDIVWVAGGNVSFELVERRDKPERCPARLGILGALPWRAAARVSSTDARRAPKTTPGTGGVSLIVGRLRVNLPPSMNPGLEGVVGLRLVAVDGRRIVCCLVGERASWIEGRGEEIGVDGADGFEGTCVGVVDKCASAGVGLLRVSDAVVPRLRSRLMNLSLRGVNGTGYWGFKFLRALTSSGRDELGLRPLWLASMVGQDREVRR